MLDFSNVKFQKPINLYDEMATIHDCGDARGHVRDCGDARGHSRVRDYVHVHAHAHAHVHDRDYVHGRGRERHRGGAADLRGHVRDVAALAVRAGRGVLLGGAMYGRR